METLRTATRHSTIQMAAAFIHATPTATRETGDGLCERYQSKGGLFPAAPSAVTLERSASRPRAGGFGARAR